MGHLWQRRGISWLLSCSLIFSCVSQTALAQSNIGNTQIVVNDVKGTVGKQEPAVLRAGIDVFRDEVIRTGDHSASKVLFQDKTNLSIGAGSEVVLDRFVFDPNPANSQVALRIARGVVRFTTGNLPKSAYQITTPTATIGIRGTVLTIVVDADGTTTVFVSEGIALVTSAGQTVTVNEGSATTVSSGVAPTPPAPTPPPPPPVGEMDTLLAQNNLAPGGAAGNAAAAGISPLTLGIAAAVAAIALGLSASGGGSSPTPAQTNATGGTSVTSGTSP